ALADGSPRGCERRSGWPGHDWRRGTGRRREELVALPPQGEGSAPGDDHEVVLRTEGDAEVSGQVAEVPALIGAQGVVGAVARVGKAVAQRAYRRKPVDLFGGEDHGRM